MDVKNEGINFCNIYRDFQAYIFNLNKLQLFNVSRSVWSHLQEKFVQIRQNNPRFILNDGVVQNIVKCFSNLDHILSIRSFHFCISIFVLSTSQNLTFLIIVKYNSSINENIKHCLHKFLPAYKLMQNLTLLKISHISKLFQSGIEM